MLPGLVHSRQSTSSQTVLDDRKIRTRMSPNCMLCGREGRTCYVNQRDRLFGATGLWNFKKCSAPDCGLIWLDPKPVEEDIAKAYSNYYTHVNGAKLSATPLRRIRELMTRGYHAAA